MIALTRIWFYSCLCLLSVIRSDPKKEQTLKLSQLPYPWNPKVSYDNRQEKLLELLRHEPISFLMHESLAPRALQPLHKNSSHEHQKIFFRNEAGETVEISSTSSEELEQQKRIEYEELLAKDLSPIERVNALPKICLVYHKNADDYWIFEWCHRKIVHQVHLEPDPMNPHLMLRQPDWSLGEYTSTDIIRYGDDQTNTSAPIKKVIDYYENGQHCDETGVGRMSQVHFRCCRKSYKNQPQPMGQGFASQDEHIHRIMITDERGIKPPVLELYRIHYIRETSVCQYEIIICMESMCLQRPETKDVNSNGGTNQSELSIPPIPSSYDLALFMGHVNNTCLFRQEDWWTYELCFNKGIRQYHSQLTAIQQPDGKIIQASEIHSEFSLGYPPLETYDNLTALNTMTIYGSTSQQQQSGRGYLLHRFGMPPPKMNGKEQDDGNRLLLEFVNGTACDIKDTMRESTVEISCGPRDLMKDIKEDRTCHYIVYVESPVICKVPSFEPRKTRSLQINIRVVDKDGNPSPQLPPDIDDSVVDMGLDDQLSVPLSAYTDSLVIDSDETLEEGIKEQAQPPSTNPDARHNSISQAKEPIQVNVEAEQGFVFLDDDSDASFLVEDEERPADEIFDEVNNHQDEIEERQDYEQSLEIEGSASDYINGAEESFENSEFHGYDENSNVEEVIDEELEEEDQSPNNQDPNTVDENEYARLPDDDDEDL